MKLTSLVALGLLLLFAAAGADPLLDRAREKEKAGDLEAAASLLVSWLSANPGAAESPSVFAEYVTVEQDYPVLLDRAASFLKTARGVPGAAQVFQTIARLYDLAGRVEDARDAWLAARREGAPDSALVSAFLLSLRMNDADSMSATLEQLAGSSAGARILLNALADLKQGNRAAARVALVGLSEQTGDPDLALKALWVLYESASETGDAAGQAAARAKMRDRFALSPESALAGGAPQAPTASARKTVVSAPVPGLLDPGTPPAGEQPAPASQPASPPPGSQASPPPGSQASPPPGSQASPPPAPDSQGASPTAARPDASAAPQGDASAAPQSAPPAQATFSVQAGSFGMKENANDLVAELGKRGFSPTIVLDTPQGKDYYRVLAGTALELDAARAVLARLSAAGYSGFLVRDR